MSASSAGIFLEPAEGIIWSWDLAKYLVRQHKVAVVPGSIFGKNGEGYLRLSFAACEEKLGEGISRMKAGIARLLER